MIKLDRAPKPAFLTAEKIKELQDAYDNDGAAVWNNAEIKKSLLASSNGKCAFCECSVSEESKYVEVEHFEYKGKYPNRVIEWENLLPSCKRCNIAKGIHDVKAQALINPYDVDPKDHLGFRLYRLKGLTGVGSATIEALDLNNSERLVLKRFEVGEQVAKSLALAKERYELFEENGTALRRNKLLAIIETILRECQPTAIFSAGTAAIVFQDDDFIELTNNARRVGAWEAYLETMFVAGSKLALSLG
jgi:hypothetical protein